MVGRPNRSLFIYSNLISGSIVGNQMTDLLREVPFAPTGDGSQYFEPRIIQYKPLHNTELNIIETSVDEASTGNRVKFGKGATVLTLHFKRL